MHFPLSNLLDDPLPELLHFLGLLHRLQHYFPLLLVVDLVVLVITHLLQQEAVSGSQSHIHRVVLLGIVKERVLELASDDLDYYSHHLADLVVEERLAFEEEMQEFNSFGIICIRHFKSIPVDVHEIIGSELQHESHGCVLRRLHVLGVVMVLLCAQKSLKQMLYSFMEFRRQAVRVHFLDHIV